MITPGRRSDFQRKLCPIQDMLHQYILYMQRLENTCQNRFSQTVFPTQNTTKFNTFQIPCLWPDIPLPTASCKPHTKAHIPYTPHHGRMDRQTRSPHDAVYCTSQTMLINHEYRLTSNGIRHRHTECHQNHPAVTDLKYAGRTDGRTDEQPDWHDHPTVFDSCIFLEQHLTLRRRIKSHLLFAGIIRSSPFSPR